jgi:hypothetical protein
MSGRETVRIVYTDGTDEIVTGRLRLITVNHGDAPASVMALDDMRFWPLTGIRSWEFLK